MTDDSPDVWIYDMVGDFIGSLTPADTPALLLREAVCSIANDIFLQGYVLWPAYARSCELDEPFAAYFDLWKNGVSYTYRTSEKCLFYISG